MKKVFLLVLVLLLCSVTVVEAKKGCCSGKGGVAYCGQSGHYVCKNGDPSPSCTCDEVDTTTYEEDKANGNLYYGSDDDYVSDDNEDNNISRSILSDNMYEAINEKDKIYYFNIGIIITVLVGGGYFALKQRKS